MPEAEELDFELNMDDVRVDTFCSSGPGGQSVNTTKSAVRLTYMTDRHRRPMPGRQEPAREQGRRRCKMLRRRLYDMRCSGKAREAKAPNARCKIGTGDRSEKIRTYNYPQNRVTDHRINFTIQQLDRGHGRQARSRRRSARSPKNSAASCPAKKPKMASFAIGFARSREGGASRRQGNERDQAAPPPSLGNDAFRTVSQVGRSDARNVPSGLSSTAFGAMWNRVNPSSTSSATSPSTATASLSAPDVLIPRFETEELVANVLIAYDEVFEGNARRGSSTSAPVRDASRSRSNSKNPV
ncbi:MAG: hypothetical protein MZU97_13670 [Bacillus subtilis]|nr:hypothetical protein [Bacillus subtilis]